MKMEDMGWTWRILGVINIYMETFLLCQIILYWYSSLRLGRRPNNSSP